MWPSLYADTSYFAKLLLLANPKSDSACVMLYCLYMVAAITSGTVYRFLDERSKVGLVLGRGVKGTLKLVSLVTLSFVMLVSRVVQLLSRPSSCQL